MADAPTDRPEGEGYGEAGDRPEREAEAQRLIALDALVNPPGGEAEQAPSPTRVCPSCSTQSQTVGDYCPYCGASFVKHKRRPLGGLSRKSKIVLGVAAAVVLLGGIGTGVVLKIQHDNDVEAEGEREAQTAADRREEAAEARREQEAGEEADQALAEIQLEGRGELESGLESEVTEDAQGLVDEGVLEGPEIIETLCDPVGGGRDDINASTGKYECSPSMKRTPTEPPVATRTRARSTTTSSHIRGSSGRSL